MRVDYTKFTPGTAVSRAGVIVVCKMCGRNGEKRKASERFSYIVVHVAEAGSTVRNGKRVGTVDLVQVCKGPGT